MASEDEKNGSEKSKQPEGSRASYWFAIAGFVVFGVLVFFKLLESPSGAPWAWGGLAFAVLWRVFPALGTRIFFLAVAGLMLYGLVSILDSGPSRSERNEDVGPGFMQRAR